MKKLKQSQLFSALILSFKHSQRLTFGFFPNQVLNNRFYNHSFFFFNSLLQIPEIIFSGLCILKDIYQHCGSEQTNGTIMASLNEYVDDDFIPNLLQWGYSYKQVSDYYQGLHPDVYGLSARSFRRYCKLNNSSRVSDDDVMGVVHHLVNNYGHSYGRRMMQGSIRSLLRITAGAVSQRWVSRTLQLVAPVAHQTRAQDTLKR